MIKVNSTYEALSLTASTLLHRPVPLSPGDTVQTGTGKVDPARKIKCTTAYRALASLHKESLEKTLTVPLIKSKGSGWNTIDFRNAST